MATKCTRNETREKVLNFVVHKGCGFEVKGTTWIQDQASYRYQRRYSHVHVALSAADFKMAVCACFVGREILRCAGNGLFLLDFSEHLIIFSNHLFYTKSRRFIFIHDTVLLRLQPPGFYFYNS